MRRATTLLSHLARGYGHDFSSFFGDCALFTRTLSPFPPASGYSLYHRALFYLPFPFTPAVAAFAANFPIRRLRICASARARDSPGSNVLTLYARNFSSHFVRFAEIRSLLGVISAIIVAGRMLPIRSYSYTANFFRQQTFGTRTLSVFSSGSASGSLIRSNDLSGPFSDRREEPHGIRQVACGSCTVADDTKDHGYLAKRDEGKRRCGRETSGVHVLARVFVMELMAGSGSTGSIIPVERRRGKKLWFRVHRGSTRDRISVRGMGGRRASGLLGITAGDIGTYAFCLTFPGPSSTDTKVIDCLIV